MKRRTGVLATSLLILFALFATACASDGNSDAQAPTTPSSGATVKIGALLDLSGDGKTLGTASKAALEAAVAEEKRNGIDVALDIRDTGSDPDTAQKEIESLNAEGVKIVIGPQTSSEAKQILAFANDNGMLVISQSSTSSALAIEGDALYRLVPTDQVEGKASADLIVTTNKGATIVTMHRDDAGNAGLATSVTTNAQVQGATVVAGPVYPATGQDFEPVVDALATAVRNAPGDDKVVYLAGFEEVADILGLARRTAGLESVPFFGGDGSAKSKAVLENTDAATFAAGGGAGFPSPLPTILDPSELAGVEADALAYAAYDALLIAVKANAAAGPDADGTALRSAFAAAAADFKGISGVITLDAAGDRAEMPFAFWNVCPKGSSFEWRESGTWTPAASGPGSIEYSACETVKPQD
jgi:branched-chain amino acid transport system substrate-binding protein